ncbi:MAG: LPXTG cell wall anchor domain-containing protein [Ilumatobacter sp.]|uniref:LPXTG cell wall anchor domain-containing protein n=1 Tax=Ilumatobacter sp. TaxID=1967498 RepID=UPI00261AD441|nr:LPXTG cell wall anchor domain-containing protein [Ilumatobacter sp.]MDJ0768951.1 LPXTG cell wall anchor domain-containing protein [Ilumatobacter sp.]
MIVRSAALALAAALLLSGCFLRSIAGYVDDGGRVRFNANVEVSRCNFLTQTPQFYGCTYRIPDGSPAGRTYVSSFELLSEFGVLGAIIDPLVLQVPDGVTVVSAVFNNAGADEPLVVTETASFPVTPGVAIDAEAGTKFLILELPDATAAALPAGPSDIDFAVELDTGAAAPLDVKPMFTVRVVEGATTYYVPTFPCVTDFAQVPTVQIPVGNQPQDLTPAFAPFLDTAETLTCSQVTYDFAAGTPTTSTTTTTTTTVAPTTSTASPTTAAPVTTAAPTTATPTTVAGVLPETGDDTSNIGFAALGLLATGLVLTLLARRRSTGALTR